MSRLRFINAMLVDCVKEKTIYPLQKEVLETLADENVYLDTAYVLRFTDKEYMKKLLLRHGEDRILFASDSPWSDIKTDVEILKSFSLGKDAEEKIFCENAKALLGIR